VSSPSLAAFRLADSFLPEGSDTLSYGLEQLVADGAVDDADDLAAVLETFLRRQVGGCDLVALRHAHEAMMDGDIDGVCRADRELAAVTMAREARESATRSGGRLLALQSDLCDDERLAAYAERVDEDAAPGNYPVVLGAIAAIEGVDADMACRVACHGFVTGLVGATQRLAAIGHTDAQRAIRDCQPTVETVVAESAEHDLTAMTSFTPRIEIASATHERADRRLFVS
jgi:urease accessory protein